MNKSTHTYISIRLAPAKAKNLAKFMSGAPHVDMKFTQFALNERIL